MYSKIQRLGAFKNTLAYAETASEQEEENV